MLRPKWQDPLAGIDLENFSPESREILESIREREVSARKRQKRHTIARIGTSLIFGVTGAYLAHRQKNESGPAIEFQQDCTVLAGKICQLDTDMTTFASEIVGHQVEVHCADLSSMATKDGDKYSVGGFYLGPPNAQVAPEIFIDTRPCLRLLANTGLGYAEERIHVSPARTAESVIILGHEITHAKKIDDEGQANCGGVALYSTLTADFKMSPRIESIDPLTIAQEMEMPAEYHSAGC